MVDIILLNKPFQVLSQFTDNSDRRTLAEFIQQKHVYAAGRLDYDSEGLLLLTSDGQLQRQITAPGQKLEKTYWAQVEGEISDKALQQLQKGVHLKDGPTRPAKAQRIPPPTLWARTPPVRERKLIPTSWLEIRIHEGRNRQVRRMTAHVGFPTLRLIRVAIGDWKLNGLQPGESRVEQTSLLVSTAKSVSTAKKTTVAPRKSSTINRGRRSGESPKRPTTGRKRSR